MVTLLLLAAVGLVILFGWLRDDPGRNPPPAGYPLAACGAFRELTAATDALAADDPATVNAAITRADQSLAKLPSWEPGRGFEDLLASLLGTLLDATTAAPSDARLETAQELVASGHAALVQRRYGFDCGAPSASASPSP